MASRDGLISTGESGLFYREHSCRKNGVRKDRQWIIRQTIDGETRISTLGWMSEGVLIGDAMNKAAEYKANHKWNKANPDQPPRPICKQDEDNAAEQLKKQIEHEEKQAAHKNITFGDYFTTRYLPLQHDNEKKSSAKEEQIYRLHIAPTLQKFSFTQIVLLHTDIISKKMKNKGMAPRSIAYARTIINQVWNLALADGVTALAPPFDKTKKKPKLKNKRERYLTEDEEAMLLTALKARSKTMHDMTIMSLDTGARWGELAKLTWQNINFNKSTARLMDTKAGDNRTIHTTTKRVIEMLYRRKQESKSVYVFPARGGGIQTQVNAVFPRTVIDLELNVGVDDRRMKVCFHSMRHTFASRLVTAGVPLNTVKEAMGHHSIAMTERYAHLADGPLRDAMSVLEKKPSNVIQLKAQNDNE